MAGSAHARYLHEMLYVYNTSNPWNDHRKVLDDQQRADRLVRSRPAYPRLVSAPVPLTRAPRADALTRDRASNPPERQREARSGSVPGADRAGVVAASGSG